MSIPHIFTLPESFFTRLPNIFIKVDLPAPLGPSKPYIEPLGIFILKQVS